VRAGVGSGARGQPGTLTISVAPRRIGLLGLASVAVIVLGALAAGIPYRGYASEGYSPLNHFVSELGEIAASRFAWAFNLGVVVGGVGLGCFLLTVSRLMSGWIRRVFVVLSLTAGTAGALCGLFPMDYLATHRLVSFAFFLTGWLVAGTFTIWLLKDKPTAFPRWLVVPGAVVGVLFVTFITDYTTYHPADPNAHILVRPDVWTVPLLEWASLLSLLAWFTCLSVSMLRDEAG
jgi:hypothetical protein